MQHPAHLLNTYARISSSNDANRCGMAALVGASFWGVLARLSRPAVRASRPSRAGTSAEGELLARTIRGACSSLWPKALRLNRRAGVGGGFGVGSQCEA